jgi:hypothetical protein
MSLDSFRRSTMAGSVPFMIYNRETRK